MIEIYCKKYFYFQKIMKTKLNWKKGKGQSPSRLFVAGVLEWSLFQLHKLFLSTATYPCLNLEFRTISNIFISFLYLLCCFL